MHAWERFEHVHNRSFDSPTLTAHTKTDILNVTRTQSSTHVKRVSQHSAESRGFSLGAPISSHKEVDLWKLTVWVILG